MASSGALAARDRLTASANSLADQFIELIMPRVCLVCGEAMRMTLGKVCTGCWARLPRLSHPRCGRCGHPTRGLDCRWCELLPPYVRAARSLCWELPDTTAQSIVHNLKYGGWPSIAEEMAERMSRIDWPADVLRERTALVPVPLGATRLRERGYNQSERLATALSKVWMVPVWTDVIQRVRDTTSQTQLSPLDRVRNVSGAFRASGASRAILRGAHVVLIDDVVTTASTLNACAAALYDGGARILSYGTFARAPADGDRC